MSSQSPDLPPRIQSALKSRAAPDLRTPDCLADGIVASLADGRLDDAARAAALRHLADCLRCRRVVAEVGRAVGDRAVADEVAGLERPRHRGRWVWISVAAAAALLLTVRRPEPTEPLRVGTHREPTISSGSAVTLVAPVGPVSAVERLTWVAIPGAERYRVTLYDATGTVIYEVEPADTMVLLPESLRLRPATRYLWRVSARTGIDRWVGSVLAEFSIVGGADR